MYRELISFKKINYIFVLAQDLIFIFSCMIIAILIGCILGKEVLVLNLVIGLFAILIVFIIKGLIFGFVFIMKVEIIDGENISLYWQTIRKVNHRIIAISDFNLELKPSGFNSPYLEISIIDENGITKIKQANISKWDTKQMNAFIEDINEIKRKDLY